MSKTPNVLFILTDQQRKDTLDAYFDGALCKTPNIDALAQQATVLTCPICTPARASLQTGLYPMHHGMLTNSYNYGNMVQELPDTPELLSRRLNAAGYQTGYTGKWHLGSGIYNVQHDEYLQHYMGDIQFAEYAKGFDSVPTHIGYTGDDFPGHGFGGFGYPEYLDWLKAQGKELKIEHRINGFYEGHQAGQITSGKDTSIDQFLVDRTEHYLKQFESAGEPWYFQLNFWGPHEPYFVASEFLHEYDDVKLPPWPNFQDPAGSQKPRVHDLKRGNISSWDELEPIIKHYYAEITSIDYQIGRLVAWLKANDMYDNTLIIFSADHGESLGIHGGLFDKAIFMYDETTTVPLMLKLPQQQAQTRIAPFVTSVDLYSTILDYAGVGKAERERDGQSFRPLIEATPIDWPDTVVTECSGIGSVLFSQRMLRRGQFKYVFNSGDIDELYDLATDPHEMVNQVDNVGYQNTLHSLRLAMRDWMIAHHDNLIYEFNHMRLPLNERESGRQF
ncbi:sulfatase-like hydrolase/transferase [Lacticaseibacillus daqingensis]|uniref:sulfatase-like hydrolase/transferase n=1 Tax=Lacticaseibacillus daqingensis TaxID=2486014 RepID=UPI000F7A8610|nr:sulfatase-like hydrolase/transferase [Lacticaseibacillus daqingensis]